MSNVRPTDYLVSFNKKDYIFDDENDYIPYLVNRWVSIYRDLIFTAQEVNMMSHLPRKMQHDYYFYSIPKQYRFQKWSWTKRQSDDLTLYMMRKYKYSAAKAKAALSVLSDEQIKALQVQQDKEKGGIYDRNSSGSED